MVFNSLEFIIFYIVITHLYFVLPHRFRWFLLLAGSCFFYMFFKPVYILILFGTIIVDYFAALQIDKAEGRRRKLFLVISLIANISVLAVFKYYNFLVDNLNTTFHLFGSDINLPFLKILLPIGLSFHTFQAMSYTIEVYRKNVEPERHFGIYSLYVMFYPQLVAGPIERPQNILYQFHEEKKFSYSNMVGGLQMIVWGLFKKVVVADRLAMYVDEVFDHHGQYEGIPVIIACVFFSLQIYFDFSAYSEIALGTARTMGFTLMKNFNMPFKSKSITEFWRRWHISLSTWFNDYLFTPLVVAKRDWGNYAVIYALLITFFLSGLWHGAGWNFIIYGLLHGVALSVEFLTRKQRKKLTGKMNPGLYGAFCTLLVFAYVTFSWIFFRARSSHEAFAIIGSLFSHIPQQVQSIITNENFSRLKLLYVNAGASLLILSVLFSTLVLAIEQRQKERSFPDYLASMNVSARYATYFFMVYSSIVFGVFAKAQFIYFQF